jgi:RNA recognition motif-containing protein
VKGSNGRLILSQKIRAEISRRNGARGIDRRPVEIQNKPPRTPHRIKISGLPDQTSWKDLKQFLEAEANVIFLDFRGRGNAIAEFAEADHVDSVVNALNNSTFQDHLIQIEKDESGGEGDGQDNHSQQREQQASGGSDSFRQGQQGQGQRNYPNNSSSRYREDQYNNTNRNNGRRSMERSRERRGRSRSRDREQYRGGGGRGGGGGYDYGGDNYRRRY